MAAKKKAATIETDVEATPVDLELKLKEIFGDSAATLFHHREKSSTHIIKTGSLTIDAMLGGGIYHGSRVELTGEPQSGKTFFLYNMMREVMLNDPLIEYIFYVDAEHPPNQEEHPTFKELTKIAENEESNCKLFLIRTGDYQQLLDQIIYLVRLRKHCIVIIDSLPMLKIREIVVEGTEKQKKHVGESQGVALDARLYTELFTQYVASTTPYPTESNWATIICVNHKYANIGGYGAAEVNKGGKAFAHIKNIELHFKTLGLIDEKGDNVVYKDAGYKNAGLETEVYSAKNQTFTSKIKAQTASFLRRNSVAVPPGSYDHAYEILSLGLRCGLIERRGAYYCFVDDEDMKFQKKELRALRTEDPDKFETLKKRIVEAAIQYFSASGSYRQEEDNIDITTEASEPTESE